VYNFSNSSWWFVTYITGVTYKIFIVVYHCNYISYQSHLYSCSFLGTLGTSGVCSHLGTYVIAPLVHNYLLIWFTFLVHAIKRRIPAAKVMMVMEEHDADADDSTEGDVECSTLREASDVAACNDKQASCILCMKKCWMKCTKCDVQLHMHCELDYHTQWWVFCVLDDVVWTTQNVDKRCIQRKLTEAVPTPGYKTEHNSNQVKELGLGHREVTSLLSIVSSSECHEVFLTTTLCHMTCLIIWNLSKSKPLEHPEKTDWSSAHYRIENS